MNLAKQVRVNTTNLKTTIIIIFILRTPEEINSQNIRLDRCLHQGPCKRVAFKG